MAMVISVKHSAWPLDTVISDLKSAAIIIEPAETSVGRLLEMLGLSSVYEKTEINN